MYNLYISVSTATDSASSATIFTMSLVPSLLLRRQEVSSAQIAHHILSALKYLFSHSKMHTNYHKQTVQTVRLSLHIYYHLEKFPNHWLKLNSGYLSAPRSKT